MHTVIATSTVKETVKDEVPALVNGHGSKSILMMFKNVTDASLETFHDGFHGLATVCNCGVESDDERLMNRPVLAAELSDGESEIIQGPHRFVCHITSFL
jgi:hypothetical protein